MSDRQTIGEAAEPPVSRPWVFADLSDDELRAFFEQECSCLTPEQSGTRHGYTCPPHRAQRELDRRHPNRVDQW